MINFQAVGQVTDAGPASVGMGDDDHLVPAIDEFLVQSQASKPR